MPVSININNAVHNYISAAAKRKRVCQHDIALILLERLCLRPGLADALINEVDATTYNKRSTADRSGQRYLFQTKQRTVGEIADILGMPVTTIRARINAGWPHHIAFSKAVDNRGRKRKS